MWIKWGATKMASVTWETRRNDCNVECLLFFLFSIFILHFYLKAFYSLLLLKHFSRRRWPSGAAWGHWMNIGRRAVRHRVVFSRSVQRCRRILRILKYELCWKNCGLHIGHFVSQIGLFLCMVLGQFSSTDVLNSSYMIRVIHII